MLSPGLVSVTFRSQTPATIIEWCRQAHLTGIEWGGDVHVPPGDVAVARQVARWTREANLTVACYGSYYRCDADAEVPFGAVLESAQELGAPTIRVWAGRKGSAQASEEDRAAVVKDLERIATLAAQVNIGIVTEYHGQTLTDEAASNRDLHQSVAHPNLKSLWQPLRRSPGNAEIEANLENLREVLPYLGHVHVYEWKEGESGRTVHSLNETVQWPGYLQELALLHRPTWLLLEFLPEESLACLLQEAGALHELIGKADGKNVA